MSSFATWNDLPVEMKLTIVHQLDLDDVRSFSKINHDSYMLSVPSLFRVCPLFFRRCSHSLTLARQSVNLRSAEALQQYAAAVPKDYLRFIRHLTISTKRVKVQARGASQPVRVTDALVDILPHCTQVEHLTLSLAASLTKAVIPCFRDLVALQSLFIDHCGDETRFPL